MNTVWIGGVILKSVNVITIHINGIAAKAAKSLYDIVYGRLVSADGYYLKSADGYYFNVKCKIKKTT